MNLELTPIKRGDCVEISADIYTKENNRRGNEFALTAEPVKFSYRRVLFTKDEGPVMLTLSIKQARQFARRLLALTRQDGDLESELEAENRELKIKVEGLGETVRRLTTKEKNEQEEIRELKEDRDRWQKRVDVCAELQGRLEDEIAVLKNAVGVREGSKDES